MSQQAVVTLNSVTYNPAGTNSGLSSWMDRSGGVSASFSPLTEKFVSNSGPSNLTKVTFRLEVPVVAESDTQCSCAGSLLRTSTCQISFWIPAGSTLAERTDLYLRVKDLISASVVSDAVEDLNPAYG